MPPRVGDTVRVEPFTGTVGYVNSDGSLDVDLDGDGCDVAVTYIPARLVTVTDRPFARGDVIPVDSPEPPVGVAVTVETVDGTVTWFHTAAGWVSDGTRVADRIPSWVEVALSGDIITVAHVPATARNGRPKPA